MLFRSRAMLRALEEPKMRSISSFGRVSTSVRCSPRPTSPKDRDSYKKFILEHITTLDKMLEQKERKLLRRSVQGQISMFTKSGRTSWPTNLADLIHCAAENEEAVLVPEG